MGLLDHVWLMKVAVCSGGQGEAGSFQTLKRTSRLLLKPIACACKDERFVASTIIVEILFHKWVSGTDSENGSVNPKHVCLSDEGHSMVTHGQIYFETATPMPHASGRSPRGGDRHGTTHASSGTLCVELSESTSSVPCASQAGWLVEQQQSPPLLGQRKKSSPSLFSSGKKRFLTIYAASDPDVQKSKSKSKNSQIRKGGVNENSIQARKR